MGIPIDKVELYRMRYPRGSRLRLTADIADPYTPKVAGDVFTVNFVDDAGQIHGSFASGGSMALVPGVDSFEVID